MKKKIFNLLVEEFTIKELRVFCQNNAKFKRVLTKLPENASLEGIALKLLDFAERQMLMADLITWINSSRPAL